ncbi:Rab guanyl-nucleotide exchange factor [Aureococcus anophagefferens]|nr:Rab guanyl-nucleotide exchange factor [Aureococcus anophagefferens]
MRKAIKPTQSANETRSRSGSDPCTSDGTPMTRSTVLPPHSSPLPLGHALDGAEHRADRYEPIATIVCAALSTALKQQLGRDALTADDARALRDAIARRDHNILALLVAVTAADAAPPAASPNNALTQRADREDVTAASVALLAAAPPAASPGLVLSLRNYEMRRIGDLLRVRLLDSEIEALYDLLDNSLDHIRLFDLTRFLDPGEATRGTAAGASPGRLELRRSSTVTTVALSPDGSRVACGGMDFYCVVWDAHRDAKLYERRFPKQVGAVALGARDLAVGCFAPGHLDYVEDLDGNGDAAASLDTTWQAGRDVNALAIFERAGELAVAAGDAVVIYAVATRTELYRFEASGTAWARAGAADKRVIVSADGGPDVHFSVPSCDAEDAAEWPECDNAITRQQSMLCRAKAHRASRLAKRRRGRARHLRGLRHAVRGDGRTYAVELDGGAVVADVDRCDILTDPERRYVDMRRAAGDKVRAPAAAARVCGGNDTLPQNRGRCEPSEPKTLGTTSMPRIKCLASRRWKRNRTIRVESDADPHAKGSLGERDRMPVWVRFRCSSRTVETHNRCVVFRRDAGEALYSVALSRSGKSVLFGGASKEVKLCDVTTAALREAHADDRDGKTLAIGHWDAYAYLVDAVDLREFGAIKRSDRVYAVALSSDGGLVAVGGRDKRAAVYAVDGDHIAALFETVHEAFVYAVALSRDRLGNRAIRASLDARVPRVTVPEQASARHDDAVLAVGRVDCLVAVFDVASEARTATIAMEGLVQNLCFAPAAGPRDCAEQNTVDVWDLANPSQPREKLVVTRHTTTNDVALSARGFVFCNGTIFSTMGMGSGFGMV